MELNHSWPLLLAADQRFDLGCLYDGDPSGHDIDEPTLAARGIGLWECDLSNNALTWSAEVYDVFGLPRGAAISRAETVALYLEHSRAAMERLRAYAIKHRRGFTLDVNIRPPAGQRRWVRLMAAPIFDGGRVVRLRGLKRVISDI
ncbi:hypothetical protein [Sphingobium boeckii]|uniref:PAS domain-containing protein n=1 Tax=Sphingobium boeckii TaxID=1082345 RepID=A0A7W9AIJ7_9SPHN|nr:hypothetical protein [Sphingobium boeckii]MBB5686218.1 PAS domain-containing protein [Sphingobium boeckii]